MEVRIPQLSEGVNDGTVVSVHVKPGDKIEKDQTLIELETEKAVAPIPSPEAGVVKDLKVKEGDNVAVGQVILTLDAAEGAAESSSLKASASQSPRTARLTAAPAAGSPAPAPAGFPPPASPSLRKMAQELGVDLSRVPGSQRGGRITAQDVRNYVHALQSGGGAAAPSAPAPPPVDFSKWGKIRREKLSGIRKTIGQKMFESWNTVPHVTQFDEADITDILAMRKTHAPAYEKKGARLTVTTFILHAVLEALKQYPIFNSSLDESTGELIYKEYCNLGIAVDTEQGLMVPVLKNADKKGLLELSKEMAALAEKARQRKVSLEDLKGGCFTISNLGSIAGTHFTPIINYPEVAILGLGKGVVKPVVKDPKSKEFQIRTLLPVAVSYDHRVIDGAGGARFIKAIARALETFDEKKL